MLRAKMVDNNSKIPVAASALKKVVTVFLIIFLSENEKQKP
jgi:hypothetical protein